MATASSRYSLGYLNRTHGFSPLKETNPKADRTQLVWAAISRNRTGTLHNHRQNIAFWHGVLPRSGVLPQRCHRWTAYPLYFVPGRFIVLLSFKDANEKHDVRPQFSPLALVPTKNTKNLPAHARSCVRTFARVSALFPPMKPILHHVSLSIHQVTPLPPFPGTQPAGRR